MPRASRVLGTAAVAALACGVAVSGQAISATQNDLNTLNYALLLERLESQFYIAGQAAFKSADFIAAGFTDLDYQYFGLIAGHEKAHVDFLASTAVLGTNAKDACTYQLGNSLASVKSYITTAALLENTGVGAYDGAINAITTASTQQAAATIATIEARHAAYLNKLSGTFNSDALKPVAGQDGPLDRPLTPAFVANAVTPFIASCNFNVSTILPQVRPGGVYTTTNLAAAQASNKNPTAGTTYTQEQYNNDNIALNYALVLEHLEADFYKTQQAKFTRQQFIDFFASVASGAVDGGDVYDNMALIASHEATHVTFLTNALNARAPGTAYDVCKYDWSKFSTISTYLIGANTLESTGVSAYDGAVNAFTDTTLQQAAATVATIEARHTSYLALIARLIGTTNSNPFPGDNGSGTTAFDTPKTPAEVLAAVTGLAVQTCSFDVQTPKSTADLGGDASAHAPTFTVLLAAVGAAFVAVFRM